MEQVEVKEPLITTSATGNDAPVTPTSAARTEPTSLAPQACPACGAPGATNVGVPVYAYGTVEARYPDEWVEKEVAQVTGRAETVGLTDRQAVYKLLSDPNHLYLVRHLCWVMMIQGLATYILRPLHDDGFRHLVEALRPTADVPDIHIVIGVRGPIAPPEMCNGLMVPVVGVDHMYSFPKKKLIESIPKPKGVSAEDVEAAADQLFDHVLRITDNAGATPGDRAKNWILGRYAKPYQRAAEQFARDFSLTAVEAVPSRLGGAHEVFDVIFRYTHRKNNFVEEFSASVNVRGLYPYLAKELGPHIHVS